MTLIVYFKPNNDNLELQKTETAKPKGQHLSPLPEPKDINSDAKSKLHISVERFSIYRWITLKTL